MVLYGYAPWRRGELDEPLSAPTAERAMQSFRRQDLEGSTGRAAAPLAMWRWKSPSTLVRELNCVDPVTVERGQA